MCEVAYYTPGIYAEGYIVFVFPFIHSFYRYINKNDVKVLR